MLKKSFLLTAFLILTSFSINAQSSEKYGNEIKMTEQTLIADIISNPEKFEGKNVLVEGKIIGVCEHMGCWIDLQGENEGDKIRVKVNDGEIVFPVEAKGKTALVEGEVYGLTDAMNSEKEAEMQEGDDCAPPKTGKKVYQIKGFGAVIK